MSEEAAVTKVEKTTVETFDDVDISDSKIFEPEQPESTEKKSEVKPDKPEPESTETPADDKTEKVEEKSDEQPEGKKDEETGEEKEEPTEPIFKIGEKVYTEAEMNKFIEDSANKEEWQKTNTEKAQETAAMRKAVEPVVQLIDKLKGNAETVQEIKEILSEVLGEEAKSIIDSAFNFDSNEHLNPFKKELNEALDENAELKGEKAVNNALNELATKHKLSDTKKKEVNDFWLKKFEETGEILEFEDAYKLMDYEYQKKKAEEKKPPVPPKVPEKKAGAKTIESKPPESYEDIDISEALSVE